MRPDAVMTHIMTKLVMKRFMAHAGAITVTQFAWHTMVTALGLVTVHTALGVSASDVPLFDLLALELCEKYQTFV